MTGAGGDPGLARLADSVLLPGFHGDVLPSWLAERLAGGLAGVCCFGQNVTDPAQLVALTAAVHEAAGTALVASDEEGGDVTRVEHVTGSSWPGAAALGRFDDVEVTERLAHAAGCQSRAAGIDLVAAPVADVHADDANPVIGIRSFGSDPALVARHVAASVRGLQAAGVAACAKHWPGHGSTRTDSHLSLPVVDDDLATIQTRDLPPFAAAVEEGVACVMTAHIRFPAVSDDPATLSATWTRLLCDELGFGGVLVSDALDMDAVAATVGRGEGAVRALAAGVDLLCIGNPAHPRFYDDRAGLDEVRDAVLAALADGRLPVQRVEEAAARVQALGARMQHQRKDALASPRSPDLGATALVHDLLLGVTEVHGGVALQGTPHVLDLRAGANVAVGRSAPRLPTALRRFDPGTTEALVEGAGDAARDVAVALAGPGRPVVAVVDAPHRHPRERALIGAVVAARPDAVVVQTGLGDGSDLAAELGADRWVRCWGAGRVHADVVADLLLGWDRETTP